MKKFKDPKSAAKQSRKLSFIDLIIILGVIVGLGLFYKLNVHRTIELQNNMKGETPVEEKVEIAMGRVIFLIPITAKK